MYYKTELYILFKRLAVYIKNVTAKTAGKFAYVYSLFAAQTEENKFAHAIGFFKHRGIFGRVAF